MIKVQPHCEYYLCNFPTGECQGMCQKAVEDDDDIQDYKKPWVGLTDEEIDAGLLRTNYAMQTAGAWRDGVEWAMKQLKEKNT